MKASTTQELETTIARLESLELSYKDAELKWNKLIKDESISESLAINCEQNGADLLGDKKIFAPCFNSDACELFEKAEKLYMNALSEIAIDSYYGIKAETDFNQ